MARPLFCHPNIKKKKKRSSYARLEQDDILNRFILNHRSEINNTGEQIRRGGGAYGRVFKVSFMSYTESRLHQIMSYIDAC